MEKIPVLPAVPDLAVADSAADPEEEYFRMVAVLANNMSVRGAATILGVSPSTVSRWRRAADTTDDGSIAVVRLEGRDGKSRPNHRFNTSVRDAEIRRRRAEGEPMRTIAEACDCSVGTVARVLKSAT